MQATHILVHAAPSYCMQATHILVQAACTLCVEPSLLHAGYTYSCASRTLCVEPSLLHAGYTNIMHILVQAAPSVYRGQV